MPLVMSGCRKPRERTDSLHNRSPDAGPSPRTEVADDMLNVGIFKPKRHSVTRRSAASDRSDKPMSILHVSLLGRPLSQSLGFKAQLAAESAGAESLARSSRIAWRTVLVVPARNAEVDEDFPIPVVPVPRRYIGLLGRRLFLWRYVREAASTFDVVLVRHSILDPLQPLVTRRLRNVAVVYHSKGEPELQEAGHPILARVEQLLMWANRRSGSIPIGVTAELFRYASQPGANSWSERVLPNGVDLGRHHIPADERRVGHDSVDVVFAASHFAPWHGLDRLLEAAAHWRPSKGEQLNIHLVGALGELERAAIADLRNDAVTAKSHGTLGPSELARLFAGMDIGIGSLALDRAGIMDACTLKVREYLAQGLPVYSTHRDCGLPPNFRYYHRDSSVDISQLIAFAQRMRATKRADVRRAANDYISKEAIMRTAAQGMLREICDDARRDINGPALESGTRE